MKKTAKLFLMACVAAFFAMPGMVRAQFQTSTNSGQVTIIGYTGTGGSVIIPATTNGLPITGIDNYAFYYEKYITHLTIGTNVTWIGAGAFYLCSSLASITIPIAVTNIGVEAFASCSSLTAINVNSSNAWYSSVNGVLFNQSQDTLIQYPSGGPSSYTVPGTVLTIAPHAFRSVTGLSSVTMSNGVVVIGDYAFDNCSNLSTLTLGCGLTTIGNNAFSYCLALTNLTLNAGVVSIGANCFQYCTDLTSVTIPGTLTTIGDDAFASCSSLPSLCLPASVTSIGQTIVQGCAALTALSVAFGNPSYSSLEGVLFDKNQTTLLECPPGLSGAYTVPGTVTTIGVGAFGTCSSLTGITIPGSVTAIEDDAFQECSGLADITIPNSVTSLGAYAFSDCYALQNVIIGNGVSAIELADFSGCHALTSVLIGANVRTIEDNAFENCSSLVGITIPDSVTNIGNDVFCFCTSLASIWIPPSVTGIGGYAFYQCAGLKQVMVGNGLTSIGSQAFYFCTNATAFYFNGNSPTLADPTEFSDDGDTNATVYYLSGTTGWGSTYGGIPTASFSASAPTASPVSATTLQNTPVDITLPVTSTTLPTYQLNCSVARAPSNGVVTLQYPALFPTDSCYMVYTPTNGFIGTDTFTFVASDGAYNSNIATAKVAVLAEIPPTVQCIQARTTPGTAVTLSIPYTQPILDAQLLSLTTCVVSPPANGSVSGGTFAPGTTPALIYTPNSGFNGVDSFTFALFDGVRTSNVANATIEVLQPTQHGSNLVLLIVNNLLLPEISNQVARLRNDLIIGGYSAIVVSWSNPSGSALWAYLHTTYTNLMATTTFLEGAILVGNVPIEGDTDLSYWNLQTNVVSTSSQYGDSAMGVPGPYQIWVSRMRGIIPEWGDEPTLTLRMLQANHDYRTGASRLPQTAFAFDYAYGAEVSAGTFNGVWPATVELSTGPSDTTDQAVYPLGCYQAFLIGGDLLAEESHGDGSTYCDNGFGGVTPPSAMHATEPNLYHRLVQIRSVLNSSCTSGALGGIANSQLATRGGGNILSIGESEISASGGMVPYVLAPVLATGMSWGNALIADPFGDNQYNIYYGDLSLPILESASNAMPVVTMTATGGVASVSVSSTVNVTTASAPVLSGCAPFSVGFTNTAVAPCSSIALTEWFPLGYDFGRTNPVGTANALGFTYYRPHRYLARVEVADAYEARAFAEVEVRTAPRANYPLRIACGRVAEVTTYVSPSLDYVSATSGKLWLQDQLYASGTWGASSFSYGDGQVYAGTVSGTQDSALFQDCLQCPTYTLPITNGTYTVNLGFADLWSVAPGMRILNIYLNGQYVTNVEPFALAGNRGQTAVTLSLPVTVTANQLAIRAALNAASTVTNMTAGGLGWINNIEVVPAGYTNHPPVAGPVSATDQEGQATDLNVLAAASDPDGDEVILLSASAPVNGSTVISNSCVVYTPRTGFAGTDTFAYVVCDGNGGFATGTVTVAVNGAYGNSPIVAPQATPALGAPPLAVTFTANATDPNSYPMTYAWSFGDGGTSTNQNPTHTYTNGGVYTVTLTAGDPYGNTGIGQVTVTASVAPVITQQPVSTDASGGSATFSVTATGAPYPAYQWLCNGVAISGATNTFYTQTNITFSSFGSSYSVIVSNCVGVTNSQTAALYAALVSFEASTWPTNWTPPAGYSVDTGGALNGAIGYGWATAQTSGHIHYNMNPDTRLDASISVGTNAVNWSYYLPNGSYGVTLSCGDTSTSTGPNLVLVQGATAINNVSETANHFVAVTNFQAVVTNNLLTLTVGGSTGSTWLNYVMAQATNTQPVSTLTLTASASPTNGTMPLAVQFTATGIESDTNPVTYAWTFGDGGASTNQNPLYTYTNAGVYTAALTANSYGTGGPLNASTSLTITVASNQRTLTTYTSGIGTGSVTLAPSGGIYLTGTVVTLTAVAGSNSTFTGWSGALSGTNNPETLVMNNNATVTASFGFDGYAIMASAGVNGTISPSGTVSVITGTAQTFAITPANWYAVSNVVVDGASVGALSSYTFSNISTSHVITASFYALSAPLGTPLWWLAQYGYTNNEQALDPNGVAVWKDYLTRINPAAPGSGAAYNIVPYAEGFENLTAWGGVYTNVVGALGWIGVAGGDQSLITNLHYTYTATNLPLPAITHTNVLQLNTQGFVLTNSFGSGFNMSNAMVYLDFMMQFGAGASAPASYTPVDNGFKGGFYVNTNQQFTIYHGVAASSDGSLLSNILDVTSTVLPSGSWHRVTWMVDATATNPANALAMFQLRLDGLAVTNANAYDNGWKTQFQNAGTLPTTSPTGTWFRFATTNSVVKTLNALCFIGAGSLDDVVVTTNNPFATLSGPYLLIITSSGNGCSSLGAGPYVSAILASGASTQLIYTAAQWSRISALASNGVPLITASGARCFTQSVLNIGANVSNAVVFALADSTQTGYTNVPTSWLTNWTEEAIHAAQGCDGFCVHDKYMLGLDPTSSNSYRLVIDGCASSGSNMVVVVRRDVSGSFAPNGMNGSLILQATPSMTHAFTNLPSTASTGCGVFDPTGHHAYTNKVDTTTMFYQITVQ